MTAAACNPLGLHLGDRVTVDRVCKVEGGGLYYYPVRPSE
jgi:hypothetical protein